MSKDVEIEIDHIVTKTEKAWLISVCEQEYWIPESKISDVCEDENDGVKTVTSIFIPEWLALEKGLI